MSIANDLGVFCLLRNGLREADTAFRHALLGTASAMCKADYHKLLNAH